MMERLALILAAAAGLAGLAAAAAQGQSRWVDISSQNAELNEAEGRGVYWGDVNVLIGEARLRTDRLVIFLSDGGGSAAARDIERLLATGDVYYVTSEEIVRADRGDYDVGADRLVLTGNVILTQGCNISTGERLVSQLEAGISRLEGGEGSGRVRSVFGGEPEAGQTGCPEPIEPPGPEPAPFDAAD